MQFSTRFNLAAVLIAMIFATQVPASKAFANSDCELAFIRIDAEVEQAARAGRIRELIGTIVGSRLKHYAKPSAFIAKDMKEIIDLEKIEDRGARNERRRAYYLQDLVNIRSIGTAVATWSMAVYTASNIVANYAGNPKAALVGVLTLPPALYVADVFGAFVHKFFDSFALEKMNFIGRAARQFRIHHEYPISLNDASYVNHVYGPSMIMAPFFAATTYFAHAGYLDPVVGTAALTFQLTLMHSMEIHRRAHLAKPGYFAEVMQKANIFLGRSQHMDHHTGDKDDNYQVVNGWSEPMAQRTRLWRRLDLLYWRYTHRMPNNWVQEPSSIPDAVYKQLMDEPALISPDMRPIMEAFPKRSNEKTVALMDRRDAWEAEYVKAREGMYVELAKEAGYETADRLWRQEQALMPTLYGEKPRGLEAPFSK